MAIWDPFRLWLGFLLALLMAADAHQHFARQVEAILDGLRALVPAEVQAQLQRDLANQGWTCLVVGGIWCLYKVGSTTIPSQKMMVDCWLMMDVHWFGIHS